jgi:hypothetical protein
VLIQGNLNPLEVLFPPTTLGIVPKPLGIFHPNRKPTLDNSNPLIGMVEVEGVPLPMLKLRLGPPLEEDMNMDIKMDGMGVGTLGRLMDGNEDTVMSPR